MEYVDIAKGLLITLVVLGHMITVGIVHDLIYSFHLFAFVFISGMFYRRRVSWAEYAKHDCKNIFIAYLVYSTIWILFDYAWTVCVEGGGTLSVLTSMAYAFLTLLLGNGNILDVSLGAIWYLPMLIGIKILARVVDTVFKGDVYRCLLTSFAIMLFGMTVLNNVNNIPWYLSSCCSALFFFFLGLLYANKGLKCNEAKPVLLTMVSILEAIVLCVSVYMTGGSNLGNNAYSNALAAPINALIGISLIINISMLSSRYSKGRLFQAIKNIVIYLGMNSLYIMGLHSEIRVALYYFLKPGNNILIFLLVFLLTMVLCVPFNCIARRFFGSLSNGSVGFGRMKRR